MEQNEGAAAEARLMDGYSLEITARDRESLAAVTAQAPAGTEVFVADLPEQSADVVVEPCIALARAGLTPVPHLVARNIADEAELDCLLDRLRNEAGIDRAMFLGGDRTEPVGDFASGLELLATGLPGRHGLKCCAFAGFPEGHPTLGSETLAGALSEKLDTADRAGFMARIVLQFAFEAEPILRYCAELRARGVRAPVRVGVGGPAPRGRLAAFGKDLGAGWSLRALERRQAENPALVETPAALLERIARAREDDPTLGIEGVHLFPFGATESCLDWAETRRGAGVTRTS